MTPSQRSSSSHSLTLRLSKQPQICYWQISVCYTIPAGQLVSEKDRYFELGKLAASRR